MFSNKTPKSFVFCPPSAVSLPLQACFFWRNLKKGGGNFDFPNATALNFPFKFVLRFFALPAKLEQIATSLFSPHSNNRPHHARGGVQQSYTPTPQHISDSHFHSFKKTFPLSPQNVTFSPERPFFRAHISALAPQSTPV